jgi:transitional endoplasmic reticulum ATPase
MVVKNHNKTKTGELIMPIRRKCKPKKSQIHQDQFSPKIENNQAKIWALRTLLSTPARIEFLKDNTYSKNDVLSGLGFETLPDDLPDGKVNTKKLIEQFRSEISRMEVLEDKQPSFVDQNVTWLGDLLELENMERDILKLIVFCKTDHKFAEVVNLIGSELNNRDLRFWVAAILNCTPEEIRPNLSATSTLVNSGLLKIETMRTYFEHKFEIHSEIEAALSSEHDSLESFLKYFLKSASSTDLMMEDYEHFSDNLQILAPYLEHCLKNRITGVNVLLYGPPGTGKTELTKVLAHHLGATLYQVMDEDADGDAMDGSKRLNSFRLNQEILGREQKCLLLFDEVEDVFPDDDFSPFGRSKSWDGKQKSWINRLLETNPVPSFWVSNMVRQIDPAFLRRFDFSMEVGVPPKSTQKKIMQKYVGDLPVGEKWIARMVKHAKFFSE